MPEHPLVIAFDVNETLSDLAPMAGRFADVGAARTVAATWFAAVLRDGFALTAAGATESFAVIAEAALRTTLTGAALDRDLDDAVGHVLAGFAELPVHPDVVDGVRALRAAGHRLVTLSNGSTDVAEQLFDRSGIRDQFEALLSVEEAGAWKPAAAAYRYAAARCGVAVQDVLLVATHPWDIDGAGRAGMSTAWINRAGTSYPGFFRRPTYAVPALTALPAALRG